MTLEPQPVSASVRSLWAVAAVEILTLAALLGNLVTVHDPALAQGLGPVHGLAYLVGIALGWGRTPSVRAKILLVVPVVGVLATARRAARTSQTTVAGA